MNDYFEDKKYWSYEKEVTLEDAFGPSEVYPRVGRESQLKEIWTLIGFHRKRMASKSPALYFHGSPGLGKTFLLRKIFEKKEGLPDDYVDFVKTVKFFVLDFNRNACEEAKDYANDFKERKELFALSRLVYVNFAMQSQLTWKDFLREAVVPLIRNGFGSLLEKLMLKKLHKAKGKGSCVILVDEIMKTEKLGVGFANITRSSACAWMEGEELCDTVLFSSLSDEFMTNEETDSGRSMIAVTTLPLLMIEESASLLSSNIRSTFYNAERNPVNRETVLGILAFVSGGHPRSIEYIIRTCNSLGRIGLEEIIKVAAASLLGSRKINDWQQLIKIVLSAESVPKEDVLIGGLTSQELVARGLLIDSFDNKNNKFIPSVPELFLHSWIRFGELDLDIRRLLEQILRTRYKIKPTDFEIIHSCWEQLMRYIRQGNSKYSKIALNELYRLRIRTDAADAAKCPVDGLSVLNETIYERGSDITLTPNVIHNPEYVLNHGWDRLIMLEAFPVEGDSSRRYVLPLFIQNKYGKNNSTTKLNLKKVEKAHANCEKFVKNHIVLNGEYSLYPDKEKNFILLFVAKQKVYDNAVTNAPSNVMFCLNDDLDVLYGPALKGFVNTVHPDILTAGSLHD